MLTSASSCFLRAAFACSSKNEPTYQQHHHQFAANTNHLNSKLTPSFIHYFSQQGNGALQTLPRHRLQEGLI